VEVLVNSRQCLCHFHLIHARHTRRIALALKGLACGARPRQGKEVGLGAAGPQLAAHKQLQRLEWLESTLVHAKGTTGGHSELRSRCAAAKTASQNRGWHQEQCCSSPPPPSS
jgi:hypothetical protein